MTNEKATPKADEVRPITPGIYDVYADDDYAGQLYFDGYVIIWDEATLHRWAPGYSATWRQR